MLFSYFILTLIQLYRTEFDLKNVDDAYPRWIAELIYDVVADMEIELLGSSRCRRHYKTSIPD